MSSIKLALALALSNSVVDAYLVLTPTGHVLSSRGLSSLHDSLGAWNYEPDAMHSLLTPFSHGSHRSSYNTWPLYEHTLTRSALPSLREMLTDYMPFQAKPQAEGVLQGWQDHGEHVEQTFSVPSGFEDGKASTLSAELGEGMDKVTVQGARAGLKFSHALPLPFALEAESDIELEHKPRAGLLTLRLHKPKEQECEPQPAALPIKRIIEEEGEVARPAVAPDSDAAAAVQVQEHAPPAKDAVATHESEQQALDEKFAFVKQAEAAPKAAAEPESQSPESSAE